MPDLFRRDLPASVVVFLIAVPLSLGIAAASGAPLMAGLIAAVAGGLVAGALSGAPLQVSGPAAGLTVIVAGVVADFGWAGTAAVVAMAGLVQIGLGAARLGRAALALSPAVVHGMLAGIGVVIALSQLHVVLGGRPQSSGVANLRDLPAQILGSHTPSLLIGLLAGAIMLVWPRLVRTSLLPAALIAVVASTVTAMAAGLDVARVDLPDDPLDAIVFPRWPSAPVAAIAVAVITIALVASVESLLSAVAVDKLHDGKRARFNKELVAQGAANSVSGMLGGLPVTGVIVRSSANVAAGARTRASAILHGVWMAVFVLLCAGLMEQIPLAALAAVLVVVGLRLVDLGQIREYVRHRELPTYLATAAGVILLDLLSGVALGMAVAALSMLWRVARCDIRRTETTPGHWLVNITGTACFVGSARLARELQSLPEASSVEVELHLDYLDHGAFQAIRDWREAYERSGGRVAVREVHDSWFHRATAGRLGSARSGPPRFLGSWSRWQAYDRGGQDAMTAGIDEFERSVAPLVRPHLAGLARAGQQPEQLFITCADSRVVPNLITGSGPGDLFCVRNVGNIVPPFGVPHDSVGAAIEYAVDVLGVSVITVCGHSGCGAVRAMMSGGAPRDSSLGRWLSTSDTAIAGDDEERCIADNVVQQLTNLRTYPSVRTALSENRLRLAGLYFDLAETRMYTVDEDHGLHRPIAAA
ncbi:SulP family inorganic anion transporter [Actinoplanes sp. NBRC 103695]|uniref:SulP family inorganic anion transporter n=1 Tax=Actinoplanes sp. NBRC 103695 TaxID=3032202 RepID=UPI0024A2639E|nr:SulP family inorganic anion transporter [Actinoplanes sp. NBRC 103695]GLY94335.1 carbonic anhydrase [Actinoplanes sp. NBRC 103695]